jgi:hypothetical protein
MATATDRDDDGTFDLFGARAAASGLSDGDSDGNPELRTAAEWNAYAVDRDDDGKVDHVTVCGSRATAVDRNSDGVVDLGERVHFCREWNAIRGDAAGGGGGDRPAAEQAPIPEETHQVFVGLDVPFRVVGEVPGIQAPYTPDLGDLPVVEGADRQL